MCHILVIFSSSLPLHRPPSWYLFSFPQPCNLALTLLFTELLPVKGANSLLITKSGVLSYYFLLQQFLTTPLLLEVESSNCHNAILLPYFPLLSHIHGLLCLHPSLKCCTFQSSRFFSLSCTMIDYWKTAPSELIEAHSKPLLMG